MNNLTYLLVLTSLFIFTQSSSFAQRIEKNEVRLTYVRLPLQPLPKEIQTYSAKIYPGEISFKFIYLKNQPMHKVVQLEAGSNDNYGSVAESENDFLVLPGYKRIPENGDLKIDVNFKKLTVNNKVTSTGTGQFSENNAMVSRTTYSYDFDYSYYAGVTIITSSNDTLLNKVFKNANHVKARYGSCTECNSESVGPIESFGASYTSPEALEQSFQERFLAEEEINWTRDALLAIKDYLNNQRGKPLVYNDFNIVSGKGKLDYSDLDTAVARMRDAAMIISTKKDIASAEPLINEAVTIWKKALEETDLVNKKARINEEISTGLQYNTGIAYAWLRKFDLCREWMTKASGVKDGQKLVKDIQWWIDDQEKRLKINGEI
jgi:hypothetical protein